MTRCLNHDIRVDGEVFSCQSVGIIAGFIWDSIGYPAGVLALSRHLHEASRFDTFLTIKTSVFLKWHLKTWQGALRSLKRPLMLYLFTCIPAIKPGFQLLLQKAFRKSTLSYLTALWVCLEPQCCTRWLHWTSWDKLHRDALSACLQCAADSCPVGSVSWPCMDVFRKS